MTSALTCLMTDLAACLCAKIDPNDEMCACGIVPGTQVAADMGSCDHACGQAWVRLITAYPAVAPGVGPSDPSAACGTFLGADIEIGVVRCIEVPLDGSPPDSGMLEAATIQQIDDLALMRSVIACCDGLADIDYVLGTYSPIGPQGLVAGGTWTLSVAL